MLHSLEPRGLGARSGVEAMLLQIAADDPDRDLLARLLTDHLDELARNKLPLVAKAIDCSLEELDLLLGRLLARDAVGQVGHQTPVVGLQNVIRPELPVRVRVDEARHDVPA